MSMPNLVTTVPMIVGTVVAAAGLNFGVLALGEPEADATETSTSSVSNSETVPVLSPASAARGISATATNNTNETGYQDSDHDDYDDDYDDDDYEKNESSERPTSTSSVVNVAQTEYLSFEFDGVATIIVARHDNQRLEFWSAKPATGWVFQVEDDSASKVKLQFRPKDGGDEAEFAVILEDGEIEVKKEY